MNRFAAGCLVMPLVLLLAAGCQDPQKRIDELTNELSQVKNSLAAAERDRQQAEAALAKYQQDYQGLQNQADQMASQMGELQARLAAAQAEANKPKPTMRNGWVVTPGASMISIESDLLFASGKADLTPAGRKKIAEVARDIRKDYPSRDIYVIGHSDTDPIRKSSWKDNWELSTERALTVTRALQSAGVSGKQIMAAGRSQYHPVSSNKAKNRRVEVYAVESRVASRGK